MQIKTVKKCIITCYLSIEFLPFKSLFLNLQKNKEKMFLVLNLHVFVCICMHILNMHSFVSLEMF